MKRFKNYPQKKQADKIVYADDMYNVEPHELYRQKAIRLYHKIVAKYSNTWWD